MSEIELRSVQEGELESLHKMQVESFMPLYEKYHDEGNPAIETLERVKKRADRPNRQYYFIIQDGNRVGAINLGHNDPDIWCYCIDKADTPNAMLSYCVFDESSWNKGIATDATLLFLEEIKNKFNLESIGAFTYSDNLASIKVLEKSGFELIEAFEEEGRESKYFQRNF